jgi:hypothetical protein
MNDEYSIDLLKIRQLIDKNEFINEIKKSNQSSRITNRCHEIIHLMVYKFCSKFLREIRKIKYSSYDDFVNDVYIYTVQQVLKFDISREKLEPFSYFTTTITHATTGLIKKTLTKYVQKSEYLKELEIEREINNMTFKSKIKK